MTEEQIDPTPDEVEVPPKVKPKRKPRATTEPAPTTEPPAEPAVERAKPKAERKRLPSGFATLRDAATFLVGVTILLFEVFVSNEVRPYVLAVGLSMAGLPLVFGADERRKDPAP